MEGRPAIAGQDGRSFAAALEHLHQAKGPNTGVATGSAVSLWDQCATAWASLCSRELGGINVSDPLEK